MDELPGSQAASKECMQMVIQYLCQRYPILFQYDNWTGMFTNRILGSKTDITTVHPLIFLMDNIPEDFFITQQDNETGLYRLTAGVACSAVGWNIGEKMGKPLNQIHTPVPDYKEKLEFSMDRYDHLDRSPECFSDLDSDTSPRCHVINRSSEDHGASSLDNHSFFRLTNHGGKFIHRKTLTSNCRTYIYA